MSVPISATKPISVLIADDHPLIREGLVVIFKNQKDMHVVAEAANGEEALQLCNQHSPDVLLLDLRMPKKDGLQVIHELTARRPGKPRIILMTTYEFEGEIRRALNAGAKGYLVKGVAPQEIREAVRIVAAGGIFAACSDRHETGRINNHPELSEQESRVLQYIADGRSSKEIGEILFASENTVKAQVKCILTKLDAMGRTEAIAVGIKRGLIKPVC